MALTVTSKKAPTNVGFLTVTEVTFDSSYLEGGEAFTPANAGLSSIDAAWCQIIHGDEAKTAEMFVSEVWYEGEKLHALDAKTGLEVASTKNMEKLKVLVFALGKARSK